MADLYLYDSDFDAGQETIIAKGMFGIAEKPVPIDDWKEAVKKTIKLADAAATEKAYDASPVVAYELLTVTLK